MTRLGGEVIATVVVCSGSDPELESICDRLITDRYSPLPAATAQAAARLCRYGGADALILDLGLPRETGLTFFRERTERERFPDIGVLALMDNDDNPAVLMNDPALAVDDRLKRPFALDDLCRRLETILRRRHSRADVVIRLGELLVDPARHTVMVGERKVHLARKEFLLLRVLASDPTRVFSKDELLWSVWGLRQTSGQTRTLDSHASRLRRKLDPEGRRLVANSWGIGYRLIDSMDDAVSACDDTKGEDR
jgi:DNA-binding response OmpR family regulator